jgi:hypothetical protein
METKTITVKPAGWHRNKKRLDLVKRMRILERAFSTCNKMDRPQEWLRLQDELREVYKKVMGLYS